MASQTDTHRLYAPAHPTAPPPWGGVPGHYTLACFNLGYLSGLTNNLPVERQPAMFAAHQKQVAVAWEHLRPDLVCYQEIDYGSRRSFWTDQSAQLARPHYPYRADATNWDKPYVPYPYWPPTRHFGRVLSGQSLHSRYPVRLLERVVFAKPVERPFFYRWFYTDRLAQVCAVRLPEGELVVINVHLEAYIAPARARQLAVVEQLYRRYSATHPVVLAGDFNHPAEPPKQVPQGLLTQMLGWPHLACAVAPAEWGAGQHCTFPSHRPAEQIDLIFYNTDRLVGVGAGVCPLTGTASDHLPVYWQFSLR
jgi:endonuclease/exonuclease/phosphatase family metal-dependent hydrolase